MSQAARDLYSLAGRMEGGSDPLAAIRAAKRVIDAHGVRQALTDPPANMGNANQGRRYLNRLHTAFGTIEGGHRTTIAVAACAAGLRDVAKECSKW